MLIAIGGDVRSTDTAFAAIGLLADWIPAVLISDITVLGRADEHARIMAAGFDILRQKPIDPIDLAHDVARLAAPRAGSGTATIE